MLHATACSCLLPFLFLSALVYPYTHSAMDLKLEAKCFEALADCSSVPGGVSPPSLPTTLVSVAHRPSMLQYHQQRLRFLPGTGGGWSLAAVDKAEAGNGMSGGGSTYGQGR